MPTVFLTRRALLDISEIDRFSAETWGRSVSNDYIKEIDSALQRLSESSFLLRARPKVSLRLRFYRVRSHFLICDVIGEHIYVLAVKHGAMDLPSRLGELEPQLVEEAELMHRRVVEHED